MGLIFNPRFYCRNTGSYGHQLIIVTTLHGVVRINVGATLVVARKTLPRTTDFKIWE
jgi:hypothetical protein